MKGLDASALILLVIAGTLSYVDRAALSIANLLIREELGLSIADMGLLLSAFLWAYAFGQLPHLLPLGPMLGRSESPSQVVCGMIRAMRENACGKFRPGVGLSGAGVCCFSSVGRAEPRFTSSDQLRHMSKLAVGAINGRCNRPATEH
jgi:MFS family permease